MLQHQPVLLAAHSMINIDSEPSFESCTMSSDSCVTRTSRLCMLWPGHHKQSWKSVLQEIICYVHTSSNGQFTLEHVHCSAASSRGLKEAWHGGWVKYLSIARMQMVSGSPQAAMWHIQVHSCQAPLVYDRSHIRLHCHQSSDLLHTA